MVKTLQLKLVLLLCMIMGAGTAWADTKTDELTWSDLVPSSSNSYQVFSEKSFTSDAVYAGKISNGSGKYIQLNSSSPNGIWTTTSGGKVKSITIVWSTSTSAGRKVDIYGKSSPYTSGDLYDSSKRGTSLGSLSYDNTTNGQTVTLNVTGDYENIGIRSNDKALYIEKVTIVWETSSGNSAATPTFSPEAGTYTSAQNVTISTTTTGATIYYTTNGSDPTTSSSVYSSAISVSTTTTIKAIAVKDGYNNSSVASATYTIKTDPALAFSSATAEATIGQTFTAPTLTNTHSVAVTWSSTDEDVATVANDGTITLVGGGTTTITASFAGDATYIASEASYTLTVTDPSVITLWSENFSSYSANDVPSGGAYSYACTNGGSTTKIFNESSAGGTAPELLVSKTNGTFTAVVPLNNASGTLTLTYKTNAKAMSVSTTTEGISGGGSFNTKEEHTVTFTGVTTSMTSITIVFTATSSDNVRLDDIVLRGSAQVVAVEAPTFSVNGGTYYTAQSVELSCATDGATIYYTTNGDEPTASSTEYTGAITVDQTMTIKAIAIKGSDQSTVSSSTYTITEKNDVVFNIADKSLAYGETYTVTKASYTGRDIQTDGYVTVSTNNAAVASVSGMTITANAVGTATITLSVAEGDTYKAGLTTITLTVTAPEGQTTAYTGNTSIFEENFNAATGTGPTEGSTWSGTIANGDFASDNDGWTYNNGHAGNGCAKFGKTGTAGTATTPSIAFDGTTTYTLTFKAGAWNEESTSLTLSCDDANAEISTTAFTMDNNAWKAFSTTIKAAANSKLTFTGGGRFFLDEVKVMAPSAATLSATLNSSGYATYCSEYPLDFTDAESNGYTAWQITNVSSPNNGTCAISFSQITGSIKGGQGVLLKGTAGETVSIPSSDSSTELSGNLLFGTTAPTFATYDNNVSSVYGLKGNTFVKNNVAGVIPANRAYLLANSIPTSAKSFTFIFENDVTGISETMNVTREEAEKIFNLGGQRLNKMQRGINIVNGKKVMIK